MSGELQTYIAKTKIVNNDLRYMSKSAIAELQALTSSCTGGLNERLYWLRNNLSSYPSCRTCQQPLTSKSFVSSTVGYRTYCGRACMRRSAEYAASYKATCLQKYGVEHSFSNANVQETRQATNLIRYGDSNPGRWSSQLFKDRMSEKYGDDNPLRVPTIRNQVSASLKQGYISSGRLDARLAEIKRLENVDLLGDYVGFDVKHEWQHSCGERFWSNLADGKVPSCPKCYGSSRPEYELYKLLVDTLGEDRVKRRDRSVIAPLELDVYLPDFKLAVELNGVYFHSELFLGEKAATYHLGKKRLCQAHGVKLLQVFDSEWREQRAIVESKLRSALGLSQRMYARKLNVERISSDDACKFLSVAHLQGADRSSKAYALIDDDGLAAVMTFCKPRFSKRHAWELSRFASKLNTTVVGGASRLLAAFLKDEAPAPGALVSYADARFSEGNLYRQLGFKELRLGPPNYWYVRSGNRLSRYQAQKHKLAKLLGEAYDPLLTEVQNMNRAKWYRLFDCGSYVFEL